jgi:hypothetical protein
LTDFLLTLEINPETKESTSKKKSPDV